MAALPPTNPPAPASPAAGFPPPKLPPGDLHQRKLNYLDVQPSQLLRISRKNTDEPFFGRKCANRFDDPHLVEAHRFGACYFGMDFHAAFAETVLHNLEAGPAGFSVPATEITGRYALNFKKRMPGPPLRLAKFYGESLLLLGGDGELMGTPHLHISRQWAAAIVRHPDHIDGFAYFSRRMNDAMSVVLFERDPGAPLNIIMDANEFLINHPQIGDALTRFNVALT